MDKPTAGLRKRQQISHANRIMLLWIAGVSIVVGVSVVLIIFLVQKIIFDGRVIAEKNHTVSVLEKNLKTVEPLKDNIRVLDTNDALKSVRLSDSKPAVQSVLDALPADPNSTALASSLQLKLLTGVSGVSIETLNVSPATDSVATTSTKSSKTSKAASAVRTIDFAFSVSALKGNYNALREVLERLEKSIRPINANTITVEAQGSKLIMTVKGVSYYEPAKQVELTEKKVKP